ncbi:MAG: HAD family hydrolase [Lachnospiraceae bacterium]|nr:HAD family hydrolase [Lachnospiraceae bacterium]
MRYKNYIFDLYATLIDIHTDQNPIDFWRRIAAIMDAYGAVYEPVELRTRYRQLIHEHEVSLANEIDTEFPEIELGDVFKELLLSAPVSRNDGIWGNPREWNGEVLDRWCSAFAYAFRVISRIKFELYPDTIALLEGLRREGKHVFLLSNAQSLFTRPEMEELGLTQYFEDIFISSEYGMKKPEPRFMRELLLKHQLDPVESVMIGNEMRSDIVMAARCGVNAILVNHDGYKGVEIAAGFEEAKEAALRHRRAEISLDVCPDLLSVLQI